MEKILLLLSLLACLIMTQARPAYDDPSDCGGKPADVIFIMDTSSTINFDDLKKEREFANNVVSRYEVAADKTRVGLIAFGDMVQVVYSLGNIQDKISVETAINNTPRLSGRKTTDRAILKALEMFSRHQRSDDVPQIIILMTDGKSEYTPITTAIAAKAHDLGMTMFAVGIGKNVDAEELKAIASKEEFVLEVDNFAMLDTYNNELALKTCNIQSDYPYDNRILPHSGRRNRHSRLWKEGKPIKSCGGRPADIVFCLDASASIWGPDFKRQLAFVQDMTKVFQVTPNMTKIGVVTFSDNPRMEFNLNTYQYEKDVLRAIDSIHQVRGSTHTGRAIKTMRDRYFTPAQSREGVVQMAIIITDGKSSERQETVKEAERLKAEGVHVFAIGVGQNLDENELYMIASKPASEYVHKVNDYTALKTIRRILALKACKVTLPPTTTTTPEPITACGERRPADIVFSIPPDASAAQAADILSMIGDCTDELNMGEDAVRIGMVPKECISLPGLKLSGRIDSNSVMGDFEREFAAAHSAKVLKYMRKKSFSEEFGAREVAQKFGILIVDSASTDFRQTAIEATKAKKDGIELFVIAVGKNVPEEELKLIASGPLDDHIFRVDSYSELPGTVKQLVKRINEACVDHVPEIEIFGPDVDTEVTEEEEEEDYYEGYGDYYDYATYGTS